MLPFPEFAFEAPDTLEEATALAAEDGAKVVAGGTDLLPSVKHRLFRPSVLVSLAEIETMREIVPRRQGLNIGATATLAEVRDHPTVRTQYPALAAACRTVATSTIQSMGTLGGNVMLDTRCLFYNQPQGWRDAIGGCLKAEGHVCHVAPKGAGCYAAQSSDTVPVLWLYGAELEFVSPGGGVRYVAVRDLFGDDGRTWLRAGDAGELLSRIMLPARTPGTHVAYRKVRPRGSIDYGSLLVAVSRDRSGSASAVLGALGPQPTLVEVEDSEDLVEAAHKAARPLNTHAWATSWRKHMVRVEVRKALQAAGVAGGFSIV